MHLVLGRHIVYLLFWMAVIAACSSQKERKTETGMNNPEENPFYLDTLPESEEAWKQKLSPEQYRVLREKGTERPFTSDFEQLWDSGTYVCRACGQELFYSSTKFDAGCGWPSFYEGIDKTKIKEHLDTSHGMVRTEVTCSRCGSHLGHVFNDGYGQPGGLRYCINGVSLGFIKKPGS